MSNKFFASFNHKRILFESPLFVAALLLGWYFDWELDNLVFFLLFLGIILHPVSSRKTAGLALAFLVATALLTVGKKEEWAEKAAIWAYYALIFTLAMSWGELQREAPKKIED